MDTTGKWESWAHCRRDFNDALPKTARTANELAAQFIGKRNPQAWFDQATLPVRQLVMDCEVYEYVEVMP